MMIVAAMAGASAIVWLAAVVWWGIGAGIASLCGVAAPLGVAAGSWVAVERTYHRNPTQVSRLMVVGFAAKMLFFGAYVVGMLKGVGLALMPFVVSFTGSFIALYVIEALALRRLFMGGSRAAG